MKKFVLIVMCLFLCGLGLWGCTDAPGETGYLRTDLTKGYLELVGKKDSTTTQVSFLLYNEGQAPIRIEKAQVVGGDGTFQLEKKLLLPLSLAPGKAQGIRIYLKADLSANRDVVASLQFSSPDALNVDDNGVFKVLLKTIAYRATSPRPVFLCGKELDFGKVQAGEQGIRRCQLTNQGQSTLQVQSVKYVGISGKGAIVSVRSPVVPFSLAPSGKQELEVVFLPGSSDAYTGRLEFETKQAKKFSLPLRAQRVLPAKPCALRVEPGKIVLSATSKTALWKIRNEGQQDCTIRELYLEQKARSPFLLNPTPSSNWRLAAGKEWSFEVRLRSEKPGNWQDTILVKSSDLQNPVLRTSIFANISQKDDCRLSVQPKLLNFGEVRSGNRIEKSFLLGNSGTTSCVITKAAWKAFQPAGSNAFQLATGLPLTVLPGRSTSLKVRFSPTSSGASYTAQLELTRKAKDSAPVFLTVAGTTGGYCLTALPKMTDFGAKKTGCGASKRWVRLYHLGLPNCPKTIQLFSIHQQTKTGSPFSISQMPPMPVSLRSGQVFSIQVSYRPTTLGIHREILSIKTDIPGHLYLHHLQGEGVKGNAQREVFTQAKRQKVDVLFVMDDSSSTYLEQTLLAKHFPDFRKWAARTNADYNIAVTTTDAFGNRFPAGCFRGHIRIITPQTKDPDTTFQSNILVGTSGPGLEQGLEGAFRALSEPRLSDKKCNAGFLRKEARLSIIFVSDEADGSPGNVDFYEQYLRLLKNGQRGLLRASAIVGPPGGCRSPTAGQAQGGPRYWSLAGKLGGRQESVCSTDWAGIMSRLGQMSFGFRKEFNLRHATTTKGMTVKVNGVTIPHNTSTGWSLEVASRTLRFSDRSIPPPGATISVDYQRTCSP